MFSLPGSNRKAEFGVERGGLLVERPECQAIECYVLRYPVRATETIYEHVGSEAVPL